MRLTAESEGKSLFNVELPQEELGQPDLEELRKLVVTALSRGGPVAFSFKDIASSPESVIGPFWTDLNDYLKNRGFDPGFEVKNYTDNNGGTNESILLIKPRNK